VGREGRKGTGGVEKKPSGVGSSGEYFPRRRGGGRVFKVEVQGFISTIFSTGRATQRGVLGALNVTMAKEQGDRATIKSGK